MYILTVTASHPPIRGQAAFLMAAPIQARQITSRLLPRMSNPEPGRPCGRSHALSRFLSAFPWAPSHQACCSCHDLKVAAPLSSREEGMAKDYYPPSGLESLKHSTGTLSSPLPSGPLGIWAVNLLSLCRAQANHFSLLRKGLEPWVCVHLAGPTARMSMKLIWASYGPGLSLPQSWKNTKNKQVGPAHSLRDSQWESMSLG